jgi:hypothetical protein
MRSGSKGPKGLWTLSGLTKQPEKCQSVILALFCLSRLLREPEQEEVSARAVAHDRRPARQHTTRRASRLRAGSELQEGESGSGGRAAAPDLKVEILRVPSILHRQRSLGLAV